MYAKISLEDVRFFAPHGYFGEEHLMGNEFSIDIEVEAPISGAAHEDNLGGTVNYATVYYLIQSEMKKPAQLLESLAYRMASRVQNQFDGVKSVKLKIRKMHPPLGGRVGAASVEINLGGSGGGAAGPQLGIKDSFSGPPAGFSPTTFDDEDDF